MHYLSGFSFLYHFSLLVQVSRGKSAMVFSKALDVHIATFGIDRTLSVEYTLWLNFYHRTV